MSAATLQVLEEFDRLPPDEQREFSAARFDYDEVSEEELTASAGRTFALLDEEEDSRSLRQ